MAKITTKMKIRGQILTKPGKSIKIIVDKYTSAFKESMKTLRDLVRENTPIGASGILRASTQVEMGPGLTLKPYGSSGGGGILEGAVASRGGPSLYQSPFGAPFCGYGLAVELGTKPHWPPSEAIKGWVFAVLQPATFFDRIRWVYFVQRHIGKTGTHARHMFEIGKQKYVNAKTLEIDMQESLDASAKIVSAKTPWWAAF